MCSRSQKQIWSSSQGGIEVWQNELIRVQGNLRLCLFKLWILQVQSSLSQNLFSKLPASHLLTCAENS